MFFDKIFGKKTDIPNTQQRFLIFQKSGKSPWECGKTSEKSMGDLEGLTILKLTSSLKIGHPKSNKVIY